MDSAMLQHNRYCYPDRSQCNGTSGARLSSIGVREVPYHSHIHDCGPFGMSSYADCGVRPGKAFRVVRNWARFLRPCAMLFFYNKNFFLFAENFTWPPDEPLTPNVWFLAPSEPPEKTGTHISVNPFENTHFYGRFHTRCWNDELMMIRSG